MGQTIISGNGSHRKIEEIICKLKCNRFLLVCDASFQYLMLKDYFESMKFSYAIFNEFTSNPLYEDVCKGVELFRAENCDCIIAVGGGSALDVAKCIKLYCKMDSSINYLTQEYADTGVPLIAVPTTAGTGSESTRYAVIYYEGKKQSVTHNSIVPEYAVLDHEVLKTLPLYQKKCTMLDALCQGIESWWSVNSTGESKKYSRLTVEKILCNMDEYLVGDSKAAEQVMLAANYSGRAINITQTTAPHAMSYKLSSLYGIPHGHAVAICLPMVWSHMQTHVEQCIDARGQGYLESIFGDIAMALGGHNVEEGIEIFERLLRKLEIYAPEAKQEDLEILATSVNPVRLKNNPIVLSEEELSDLYERIMFK